MKIVPLCSSSAANSTFVGSHNSGVLIDAGCSYKALRNHLSENGIELSAVKAVLITHEHCDHVKGLFQLTKHNDIPVFSSRGTCDALLENKLVYNPDMLFGIHQINQIGLDCEIKEFNTPHDSAQSVGFTITCNSGTRFAYMTDLGEITQEVEQATLGCGEVLIESNYDSDLLWSNNNYPYQTKQRIDSRRGHLSNTDSADYIMKLIQNGATKITLGHLSPQNNTPQIAYSNTVNRLSAAGIHINKDYTLKIART